MRKKCFVVLFLVLWLLPVMTYADAIAEPTNLFYSLHQDACVRIHRTLYANGENGFVLLKDAPNAVRSNGRIENGEAIHVQYAYNHKGEIWGYSDYLSAWMPMNQLLRAYDYRSFEEDHQNEIQSYNGEYAEQLRQAGDVVFWTWPGSGVQSLVITKEWRGGESFQGTPSQIYTDSEGRTWGFFVYVTGHSNSWVCLSDPENTEIEAFFPTPPPELWIPDIPYVPSNGLSPMIFMIVLVAAVVMITALLIRAFWKRK